MSFENVLKYKTRNVDQEREEVTFSSSVGGTKEDESHYLYIDFDLLGGDNEWTVTLNSCDVKVLISFLQTVVNAWEAKI